MALNKTAVASTVLGLTLAIAFGLPKIKYVNPLNFELQIPRMEHLKDRDISRSLNMKDARYKFVNKVIAHRFISDLGEQFLFLVLDAANFHNPRVCFGSAGYKVRQLDDVTFELKNHKFNAQAVYAGKDGDGLLILYWIIIDQKPVNWAQQKLKQFWFSLFNKKRVGLMVRLDISARENQIPSSILLAREFARNLEASIPPEKADYLFGKA